MADNFGLPQEYQDQIDAEQRKQALAQLLLKQSMGFQGAQNPGGRIAAKTSPLAWIANSATNYLGTQALTQGDKAISTAKAAFGNDQRAELENLQGLTPEDAIKRGEISKFPMAQAMAKAIREQRSKQLESQVKAISEGGDTQGAVDAASGTAPIRGYSYPGIKPTEQGLDPQGNAFSTTYNRKLEPTLRYAPKSMQITNNLPGNEAKMGLDVLEAGLKPREEAAVAARNVYASTSQAVDALSRGAQAGGGEAIKQGIRKVLQGFGVTTGETATTEQLGMALGNTLLSEAAKIKPISNTDISTLEKIVGSIGSDPTALTRALAFSQAMSLDAMHNFDRYVGEQEKTVQNDLARTRLAGVRIGREAPKSLTGPAAFQLEVLRTMQNAGLDISRFNQPGTKGKPKGAGPFDENTDFNIDPSGGFPGVGAAKKPTSPEERIKLLEAWITADPARRGPKP